MKVIGTDSTKEGQDNLFRAAINGILQHKSMMIIVPLKEIMGALL